MDKSRISWLNIKLVLLCPFGARWAAKSDAGLDANATRHEHRISLPSGIPAAFQAVKHTYSMRGGQVPDFPTKSNLKYTSLQG